MTRSRQTEPAILTVPDAWMRPFISRIAERWQATDVVDGLAVEYNPRLRRSLARVSPATRRVTLHQSLEEAPRATVREILAHELAHLVAASSSRTRIKPHGEEWASLMESAGFRARSRSPFTLPDSAGHTRSVYNHVCPVCHASRRAKRPVSKWRCTDCVANGLDGTLVIEETGGRTFRCSAFTPSKQEPPDETSATGRTNRTHRAATNPRAERRTPRAE